MGVQDRDVRAIREVLLRAAQGEGTPVHVLSLAARAEGDFSSLRDAAEALQASGHYKAAAANFVASLDA